MSNPTPINTSLHTIRPGDPKFCVHDGHIVAHRAGLEVNDNCPPSWKTIAQHLILHGWITPVAVVKDTEFFWEELSK